MFLITTIASSVLFISTAMMILSSILSKKTFSDREKSSPFECGFDPNSSPRLPFSLQFFLLAVIFLIFDIEIALLIPLISIMKISELSNLIMITSIFILILLIGLYHEWIQGSLSWAV
uniref:NADH-ubiquinone oxidoreductase chain 3 n=1 Tax=Cyclommatus strigiceps vitalisi TaxID=618761 RepID=A0A5H2F0Y6_9SCAR|nr:NADH dehydrogenase subunit 3 [Cyclommatus strigiceps vitalisi]ASF90506.1 NADH dehydrogenase subunit 3 [Cyclommatus strigiceps vitalisi]